MKVLEGELVEERFAWPHGCAPPELAATNTSQRVQETDNHSEAMTMIKRTSLTAGNVAYIHDTISLHRIRNPSSHKNAVSLHLYAPPYEKCRTFVEATGESRAQGKCGFWSINGVRT
ncbi:hypothetical protein HDU93_003572 [Gonapodya sp. JEL0774]|nr:hypothetical protein HDU93_003572 [Gonapodya sp. JEL0774]